MREFAIESEAEEAPNEDGTKIMGARLTAIGVRRFKSYEGYHELPLNPLTVLYGKNNSGKSTFIQALLLLHQTLRHPRWEVPLHLAGSVNATSLRTLTTGWPEADEFDGPEFTVKWRSNVSFDSVLDEEGQPEPNNLAHWSHLPWLGTAVGVHEIDCTLRLKYRQEGRTIVLNRCEVNSERVGSKRSEPATLLFRRGREDGGWLVFWMGKSLSNLEFDFEHFIPYLAIDKRNLGPRHRNRSRYIAYRLLMERPLQYLRYILQNLSYLGSVRAPPQEVYSASTTPPEAVGASGEQAAQLLHARQDDAVTYLPPLEVNDDAVVVPVETRSKPLVEAVNDVLDCLTISVPVGLRDIEYAGFQILFGRATVDHVGKGLGYILPLVTAGLVAVRDEGNYAGIREHQTFRRRLAAHPLCAFEEPETHLHPRVQSRLAHWFVSQALMGRQQIVETHSDHLVRRLRGLIARSKRDSELEKWLLKHVVLVEVEQAQGISSTAASRLDPEGGIKRWPREFMDEAADEEAAISFSRLDKIDDRPHEFDEGASLKPGRLPGEG